MIRYFIVALLAVHLLYLLLFPSLAARGTSAIGMLVSLMLLAGPAVSSRFAAQVRDALRGIGMGEASLLLALFALPLVSLIAEPRVAFWRIDGRALVIAAWLLAISGLLARRPLGATAPVKERGGLPMLTRLFILWSTLFWFMLVWDVGVGQAVVLVTREDRLTTSWELWETRPPSAHLFLAWLSREAFEDGIAYTNHLHPFLFVMYGFSKLVQLVTGLPMAIGRNLTPFAMAALGVGAFTALIPRPVAPGPAFHATLFLALGFLATQWFIWVYPFTWGFDTVFPIVACLAAVVWASARPRLSSRPPSGLLVSVVLFAAFGWIYTPLVILALWCLFARPAAGLAAILVVNRPLALTSLAGLIVGATFYALPLVLVHLKGLDVTSSSVLFRSGLDGDMRYFQDAGQAVFNPFRPARTLWRLFFPAFVPFVAAAVIAWRAGGLTRRRFGRESAFLLAPYLFSLALFPQSVSIHPNLYDALLLLPIVLIGSEWTVRRCVQERLQGGTLLIALLLATILIMSNLIGIAQGMQRVAPG